MILLQQISILFLLSKLLLIIKELFYFHYNSIIVQISEHLLKLATFILTNITAYKTVPYQIGITYHWNTER